MAPGRLVPSEGHGFPSGGETRSVGLETPTRWNSQHRRMPWFSSFYRNRVPGPDPSLAPRLCNLRKSGDRMPVYVIRKDPEAKARLNGSTSTFRASDQNSLAVSCFVGRACLRISIESTCASANTRALPNGHGAPRVSGQIPGDAPAANGAARPAEESRYPRKIAGDSPPSKLLLGATLTSIEELLS